MMKPAQLLIGTLIIAMGWSGCRPRPHHLRTYEFQSDGQAKGGLKVQFLGNTNLLLDDGETRILTDGFFSRPGGLKMLFGKVEPKPERIRACLEKAGISQLDAVIPVHSHYDHAMDAPLVAQMTGATLLGSASTLMIGEGAGLAPTQMQLAPLDSVVEIGKFKIRFIASRHWQYPSEKQRKRLLDQAIEEPLVPPASVGAYKEGISYSILIEHEDLSLAIQGSAGFLEDALPDFDADILFLSVAGIQVMDDAYNDGYQEHVVAALHPEVIVPIHWDDFTVPLKSRLKTTSRFVNLMTGLKLQKALEIVEQNNPNRAMCVLPLWDVVSVPALLEVGMDD